MLSIFKTPRPNRPNESDDAPYTEPVNEQYPQRQPAAQPIYQPTQTGNIHRDAPVTPPQRSEGNPNTVVGKGMVFHGEIKGKGSLQIDGQFIGTLDIDDLVVVGESGQIEGDVHSKLILVHGKLKGNVSANDKVTINARGTMIGDIVAPRVVVSDGAIFKGRIDMESKTGLQQKPTEEPPKKVNSAVTPPVPTQPTPPIQKP
jgi:cytoskeletal protein CcmA (bactofilin family)